MSNELWALPITLLTKSRSRNARNRARTGAMTWPRNCSLMPSYQSQNPPRPVGANT